VAGLAALTPGSLFAGDFRIERSLAEGGMGAVYVAEQLSTGKRRALKVMHPQLVPDERSRQRFVEEARVGSRIDSEHVVEVVGAGVDATTGVPWLAMELLEGENLDELVRHRGPLPALEVLTVLEQVGHALAQAHARGIVHRDLKPENLFSARSRRMNAPPVVKILDFGIARTIAESRSGATVTSAIGSPLWMAPEQAQPGAHLRPATDVWALGLIAFYLLTGRSYWLAANHPQLTLQALLVELMTQPIEAASVRVAALGLPSSMLPPHFDAWFLRCVERNVDARFPDAGVAVHALRSALLDPPDPPPIVVNTTPPIRITSSSSASSSSSPWSPSPWSPSPAPTPSPAPEWRPASTTASPGGKGAWLVLVVLAVVVVLGGAGAVAAFVLGGRSEGPTRDRSPVALERAPVAPQPPRAPDAIPSAGSFERALAACRAANAERRYAEALTQADAALALRPTDATALACRAEAQQGQTFERGAGHLARGEDAQAYLAFEELPADSPFRSRPQVATATQRYASVRLNEGQSLLATSPADARSHAQFVLAMNGITTLQREQATALDRAAQSRLEAREQPEPPRREPTRERPREPVEAPRPPADIDAEARRCLAQGDNACVIRVLEGRATTERQLGMLIEAYRARGQTAQALRHMRTYVQRYPESPRSRQYQQILMANGG
jgi:serine/threonine protein kinase